MHFPTRCRPAACPFLESRRLVAGSPRGRAGASAAHCPAPRTQRHSLPSSLVVVVVVEPEEVDAPAHIQSCKMAVHARTYQRSVLPAFLFSPHSRGSLAAAAALAFLSSPHLYSLVCIEHLSHHAHGLILSPLHQRDQRPTPSRAPFLLFRSSSSGSGSEAGE